MILPKFDNPRPTVEWLNAESIRLKKQADRMLKQTNILDRFVKYGRLSDIGGSYLYNLMIYPDIDLSVVANKVDDELIAKLMTELVKHKSIRGNHLVDTYHLAIPLRY